MAVNILAIETSCDESSAAIVADGREIKSNIISSQIDVHKKFGGVVPEIASRKHLEAISLVVQEALDEAGTAFKDLDAVAVTYGPGLVGALLVGLSYAKAAAFALNKPLIGVHHLEGHIHAGFLEHPDLAFPLVALVVSGGHTSLVYLPRRGEYVLLGQTRDDAAGEAFDKVARHLGLGYPGGPQIQKAALQGNKDHLDFPKAWLEEGSLDFSFSGLKSSVLSYLNRCKMKGEAYHVPDIAAGLQEAIVEVLSEKAVRAAKLKQCSTILLAGGVAANLRLREVLKARAEQEGIHVVWPSPLLCTDNGAMIGCAAYYKYMQGDFAPLTLNAVPNLSLFMQKN
ncbi:tRNA (adenosine(37)-N6)-threonylcarbamoyltransferase complex transferase subunit TsaD [Candidatus Formimonas warabiya]|uniref:tRNA N6-adenosine threonylcarbamoyltransferase n=1 Tax=Formimonas warabiya TaxID=1761012 RepID=A0A3G1KSY0_FORW1|nr:tRNA (adenosine(37)-N6)-threonylcarbamoyltransferase complex transferase subunit TsaD [Candidatus Formimonas warabiya]ATW25568.1 tRNA (adenosine(37)-N6)-threonylcarbamoyltransferase complex transferase subunit TsaD [Candidatus Formimonas warabiya]